MSKWRAVVATVEFFAQGQATGEDGYRKVVVTSHNDIKIESGDNGWWITSGPDAPVVVVRFDYILGGEPIRGKDVEQSEEWRN